MYRLIFIAKNNLKKKKSDVAVLFFLIMLAALLLYVSISVLTHTKDIIQNVYDKTNSADFFLSSGCEKVEEITSVLEEQPEVVELEIFFDASSDPLDQTVYLTEDDWIRDDRGNCFFLCEIRPGQRVMTLDCSVRGYRADGTTVGMLELLPLIPRWE